MTEILERDSNAYRVERLEEERERLERRLEWAVRRGDAEGVKRLTERLEAIEEAIDADVSPGCPVNRHEDRTRILRTGWR